MKEFDIHERISMSCEQCNMKYNDPSGLRKFKTTVHEGIWYPCEK